VYCPADQLCYPPEKCGTSCIDRPIVDYALHMCVALWWAPEPLTQWTNWVCRPRNKVGMPCRNDQDCIFGLRRCLLGECQPFKPYTQNCTHDHDCPHLGYYCPSDPTGGKSRYWVKYCRRQRAEGLSCAEDRECAPDLRCNVEEPQPRCRRLFSLEVGSLAAHDSLCMLGWRDRNNRCAPAARSKQRGRGCDSDSDCVTTDGTGRFGQCVCKSWWDRDDAKYCLPVAGDYDGHQEALRNYLSFRFRKCGSFWTEEECLDVFGQEAMVLKLEVECETQRLAGGPFLPPAECGIHDSDRFPDPCTQLEALKTAATP